MGGYGSGRRQCGRATVEQSIAIDAQRVAGGMPWLPMEWECWGERFKVAAVNLRNGSWELTVARKVNSVWYAPETVTARTITSVTPLGGLRFWWACPLCERKCQRLYVPPLQRFAACRVCWNLAYSSQQRNHRPARFIAALMGSVEVAKLFEQECERDRKYEKRVTGRNGWRRVKRFWLRMKLHPK